MRFSALPVHSFEDATLNMEQLQALLTLPAWTVPTLLGTWANSGAPFETAGYLKDGLGFVHLKGVVGGGVTNTSAFTLPAGYRPGAKGVFPPGLGGASGQWSVVAIDTAGAVNIQWATNGTFIGLSGITFRAEN